jgi:hypothetical protein
MGVKVLAVISEASRDKISDFKDQFNTSYLVLADPNDTVKKLYKVQNEVTTIIVDREGVVRYIGGFTTWTEMAKQVETISASEEDILMEPDLSTVQLATESLKGEKKYVRWKAARALGEMGDTSAVPDLLKALDDLDRFVRLHVMQALGKLSDKQAVEPLLEVVKRREDEGEAEIAIQSLGQIGDRSALPTLLDALNDKSKLIRQSAVKALGNMKDERAVSKLIPLIYRSEFEEEAINALADIGEVAVESIMKLLEGTDKVYYGAASEVLVRMIEKSGPELVAKALNQEGRTVCIQATAPKELARIQIQLGRGYRERKMYDEAISVLNQVFVSEDDYEGRMRRHDELMRCYRESRRKPGNQ